MGPLSILWGWVLVATMSTGAAASLVEQKPRWVLVARGQAKTLHCLLRNSQYPWMSWYQQDFQGSLQVLATLRSPGDEEVVSRPGADYRVKRVNSEELRLHVTNVTQGRRLYSTCSTHTRSSSLPERVDQMSRKGTAENALTRKSLIPGHQEAVKYRDGRAERPGPPVLKKC